MPFVSGEVGFVFNGELHGVRLGMEGRTGARRILNLMQGLDGAASMETNRRTRQILENRTRRILGMNWIVAGTEGAVINTFAAERPDYYTMHRLQTSTETVVCSVRLDRNPAWQALRDDIREEVWCS